MVSWVKAHLNTLWPNTFGPKSPSESLKIFDDMDPMTWISLLVVLPPVVTGNTYNEGGPRSFDFLPLIRFEQEPQVRDNFVHTKRRERNGLFAIEQRRERTVQVAVVSGAHTLCCVWELSMERETRQVGITTGSSELVYIYLYIYVRFFFLLYVFPV